MSARIVALLLAASSAAFAGDWKFDDLVSAIETHYGVKHTRIPLLGVASFFVKVARPAGTSELRLAIFEDFGSSVRDGEAGELDRLMSRATEGGLHPLVRTRSANGEATYVYTGEAGKSTRMLVATFGRNEATLIQVRIKLDALLTMLEAPERIGKSFAIEPDGDRE